MSEDYFHPGDDGWAEIERELARMWAAGASDQTLTAQGHLSRWELKQLQDVWRDTPHQADRDRWEQDVARQLETGQTTVREIAAKHDYTQAAVRRIPVKWRAAVAGEHANPTVVDTNGFETAVFDKPEAAPAGRRIANRPSHSQAAPSDTGDDHPAEWPPWWSDLTAKYERPEPIATTTEGTPLFFPRRETILFGANSTLKSTLAIEGCSQAIKGGQAALFLSWEMDPAGIRQRLDEMGLEGLVGHPMFRVVYIPNAYEGSDRPSDAKRALEWAKEQIAEGREVLVVIDSVSKAGGATDIDKDYLKWHARSVLPWKLIGATPLLIDHIKKHKQGDDDEFWGPRGTGAKADQAEVMLNAVLLKPGTSKVVVVKHRYLEYGKSGTIAVAESKPLDNHRFEFTVRASVRADSQAEGQALEAALRAEIEDNPGINTTALARAQGVAALVGQDKKAVTAALNRLMDKGLIVREDGPKNSKMHFLADPPSEDGPLPTQSPPLPGETF